MDASDSRVVGDQVAAAKQSSEEHKKRIPVLLLKTKSTPSDGYEEYFRSSVSREGNEEGGGQGNDTEIRVQHAYEPVFVPVLEHRFEEGGMDSVRRALKERKIGTIEGKEYGGLIFTSQRAVEAFAKLVQEGIGRSSFSDLQFLSPWYKFGGSSLITVIDFIQKEKKRRMPLLASRHHNAKHLVFSGGTILVGCLHLPKCLFSRWPQKLQVQ